MERMYLVSCTRSCLHRTNSKVYDYINTIKYTGSTYNFVGTHYTMQIIPSFKLDGAAGLSEKKYLSPLPFIFVSLVISSKI